MFRFVCNALPFQYSVSHLTFFHSASDVARAELDLERQKHTAELELRCQLQQAQILSLSSGDGPAKGATC